VYALREDLAWTFPLLSKGGDEGIHRILRESRKAEQFAEMKPS
jgi:hypothetical protein